MVGCRGSVTVNELASIIDEKPIAVIKFLMTDLGIMASMTQGLDRATSIAVAEGFGRIVDDADDEEIEYVNVVSWQISLSNEGDNSLEESALATGYVPDEDDDEEDLETRSPVVTIMGHVCC